MKDCGIFIFLVVFTGRRTQAVPVEVDEILSRVKVDFFLAGEGPIPSGCGMQQRSDLPGNFHTPRSRNTRPCLHTTERTDVRQLLPCDLDSVQQCIQQCVQQCIQDTRARGPGVTRADATRTDPGCRVVLVATSRRVAPTECDSRLL